VLRDPPRQEAPGLHVQDQRQCFLLLHEFT
jgi:hypothetical protein